MLRTLAPARSDRGFTLVELIVAIVVLGILAALLLPSFRAVERRVKIDARVIEVVALAREAAALAAFNPDTVGWTYGNWETAADDVRARADDQPSRERPGYEVLLAPDELTTTVQIHLEICDPATAGVAALVPGVPDVVALVAVTRDGGIQTQQGWALLDEVDPSGEGALAFHGFDPGECTGPVDGPGGPGGDGQLTADGPDIVCDWPGDGTVHCYGRNYHGRIVPNEPAETVYERRPLVGAPPAALVVPTHDNVVIVTPEREVVLRDPSGEFTPIIDPETSEPVRVSPTEREPVIRAVVEGDGPSPVIVKRPDRPPLLVGRDPVTGTVHSPSAPRELPPLPGGRQLRDIECAANFICALATDGTVWCMGYNTNGQLGDASPIRPDQPADEWVQVRRDATTPVTGATQLALGELHAAVATNTGQALAWGKASLGATGDDNTTTDRNVAVAVCDLDNAGRCTNDGSPHLSGIVELYPAGPDHTCTLLTGDRYACWGNFDDTTHPVPTLLTQIPNRWTGVGSLTGPSGPGGPPVPDPVLADNLTDATCSEWQRLSTAHCLDGGVVHLRPAAQRISSTFGSATNVSTATSRRTFDLTNADSLTVAWEQTVANQENNSAVTTRYRTAVRLKQGTTTVQLLMRESRFDLTTQTIDVSDRTGLWQIELWSEAYVFSSGNGTAIGNSYIHDVAVNYGPGGQYGTGTLYAWGSGPLGDGTTSTSPATPAPVDITSAGSLAGRTITTAANAPSVNGANSYVVTADGQLHAWGHNQWSLLGDGTTTPRILPAPVDTGSLAGATVAEVTASAQLAGAITTDGQLHVWGRTAVGNGQSNGSTIPVHTSAHGSLVGKTVTQVALGDNHGAALASDGTLHTWGVAAQVGTGTSVWEHAPVELTASGPLAGQRIVEIAAGAAHTLAVTEDGTLYAWGANNNGQLGDGTYTTRNTPVEITGRGTLTGTTATTIAARGQRSYAIAADGTVHGWGFNFQSGGLSNGILGDGTTTTRTSPVLIEGSLAGRTAVSIHVGGVTAYAITSDGVAHGWGSNGTQRRVGDFGTGIVTRPVVIRPAEATVKSIHAGEINVLLVRH